MATVVRTYHFVIILKHKRELKGTLVVTHGQMDVTTSEYNACIIPIVVSVIFMLEGGKDDLSPN